MTGDYIKKIADVQRYLVFLTITTDTFNESYFANLRNRVTDVTSIQFRVLPFYALKDLRRQQLASLILSFRNAVNFVATQARNDLDSDKREQRYHEFLILSELQRIVTDIDMQISSHTDSLFDGTFFLSLDVVCKPIAKSFELYDVQDFMRTHHVNLTGYRDTATKAFLPNALCVNETSSRSSHASKTPLKTLDIFGAPAGGSELALLLPHSPTCATFWFPIVPWVVLIPDPKNLSFDVAQKCIHGFAEVPQQSFDTSTLDGGSKIMNEPHCESVARKPINNDQNDDDEEEDDDNCYDTVPPATAHSDRKSVTRFKSSDEDKDNDIRRSKATERLDTATLTKGTIRKPRRLDDDVTIEPVSKRSRTVRGKKSDGNDDKHEGMTVSSAETSARSTTSSTKKKSRNVGIKHFFSNRIMLRMQREYFDSIPSLLIIPILTKHEVAQWQGKSYSAIVLAGAWEKSEGVQPIAAADVYDDVKAYGGGHQGDYLATPDDAIKAITLLTDTILCLAKSCQNRFKKDRRKLKDLKIVNKANMEAYTKIGGTNTKIPVPNLAQIATTLDAHKLGGSGVVPIRKILFSDMCTDEGSRLCHFAPDPVLLVSKAASSWLKRQRLELLPGGEDNAADDFMISAIEEAKLRSFPVVEIPSQVMSGNTSWDDSDSLSSSEEDDYG